MSKNGYPIPDRVEDAYACSVCGAEMNFALQLNGELFCFEHLRLRLGMPDLHAEIGALREEIKREKDLRIRYADEANVCLRSAHQRTEKADVLGEKKP